VGRGEREVEQGWKVFIAGGIGGGRPPQVSGTQQKERGSFHSGTIEGGARCIRFQICLCSRKKREGGQVTAGGGKGGNPPARGGGQRNKNETGHLGKVLREGGGGCRMK